MVRDAIEKYYTDTATIETPSAAIGATGRTTPGGWVAILTDAPCRLSFDAQPPADGGTRPATAYQGVKLFLAPETYVPPGCRIKVTREGRAYEYRSAGLPAAYPTHQEISLKREVTT